MSRSLSSTFKAAIFSQETAEVFLVLLELDHADLAAPLRVVNNYENITSNGEVYIGYPFSISIPDETEDAMPIVKLTIDNVDRSIVEAVRTCTSAPAIVVSVVLASAPDTIEAGPFDLTLRAATYDALSVSGEIRADDILNEPWPGVIITPQNFPGLFL